MILPDFVPFPGKHCETTTAANLLARLGITLSEPMLFGIGQGLAYIYWDVKGLVFPFVGGRSKPSLITRNVAAALGLRLEERETASVTKAFANAAQALERGLPAGIKLDSYYLDYFSKRFHFPAHYVCLYGLGDTTAYLADTAQQGGLRTTSLESLALARSARGPMSSRNLSYTLEISPDFDPKALRSPAVWLGAAKHNAMDFLNPPTKNFGWKGFEKTAAEVRRWLNRSSDPAGDFKRTALLMERGGTGGALFRLLYRDFLAECLESIANDRLTQAHRLFSQSAALWSHAAHCIAQAGLTLGQRWLDQASLTIRECGRVEKQAMERLAGL